MKKVMFTVTATGSSMNVSLGMIPDRVTITNVATRTAFEIGSAAGTIGYAIEVAATGTRTDGASKVSFYEGDHETPAGLVLGSTLAVNAVGNTLMIECECFH